jgi:hypothetical protein
MAGLKKAVAALKNQLEKYDITGNAIERQTISHLNRLIAADEKAFEIGFADLKQFWLSSVDWCSELSKQIEKLIIMHEDLLYDETRPSNYEK